LFSVAIIGACSNAAGEQNPPVLQLPGEAQDTDRISALPPAFSALTPPL
jgi:hypothetical protein